MQKNNFIPTGGGILLLMLVLGGIGFMQTSLSTSMNPPPLRESTLSSNENTTPKDWKKEVEQQLEHMILEPLPPVRIENGWRFRFQVKEGPKAPVIVPVKAQVQAEFNIHPVGVPEEQGVHRFVKEGEVDILDIALPPGRYLWSVRTHFDADPFHSVAPWMPWVAFDNTPRPTETPATTSQAAVVLPIHTETSTETEVPAYVEAPELVVVMAATPTPPMATPEPTKRLTGLEALPKWTPMDTRTPTPPPVAANVETRTAGDSQVENPLNYFACVGRKDKTLLYKVLPPMQSAADWVFQWKELLPAPSAPKGIRTERGPTPTPIPCVATRFLLRRMGAQEYLVETVQTACEVAVPKAMVESGQHYEWLAQCLPENQPKASGRSWMDWQAFTPQ